MNPTSRPYQGFLILFLITMTRQKCLMLHKMLTNILTHHMVSVCDIPNGVNLSYIVRNNYLDNVLITLNNWFILSIAVCNGVKTPCFGEVIRSICHLALEDYNQIINETTCFVANKFNIDVDVRPILNITRNLSPIKDFV